MPQISRWPIGEARQARDWYTASKQARESYNSDHLTAGGAAPSAGASFTTASFVGVVALPPTGQNTCSWTIWKQPEWTMGGFLIWRIFWTGDTADDTTDIQFELATQAFRLGDALNDAGTIVGQDQILEPGPAVQYAIKELAIEDPVPVAGDELCLVVTAVRSGSSPNDDYGGDVLIVGGAWEYLSDT